MVEPTYALYVIISLVFMICCGISYYFGYYRGRIDGFINKIKTDDE